MYFQIYILIFIIKNPNVKEKTLIMFSVTTLFFNYILPICQTFKKKMQNVEFHRNKLILKIFNLPTSKTIYMIL